MESNDILQPIPYDKLKELRDMFKRDWPSHIHVYYLLDTFIRWKKLRPTENYATVYCSDGNFEDGTFIAIIDVCNIFYKNLIDCFTLSTILDVLL